MNTMNWKDRITKNNITELEGISNLMEVALERSGSTVEYLGNGIYQIPSIINNSKSERQTYTKDQAFAKFILVKSLLLDIKGIKEVVLGGSLSLILQGYDLGRDVGDLDITIIVEQGVTNYELIREFKERFQECSSSSRLEDLTTFSYTIEHIKCDLFPRRGSTDLFKMKYEGNEFYIEHPKTILAYKIEMSNQPKHREDLLNLIVNKPVNFNFSHEHTL